MTREILLIQLGLGGVGQALAQQVLAQHNILTTHDDVRLRYLALVDSSGALYMGEPITDDIVANAVSAKQDGQKLVELEHGHPVEDWGDLLPGSPCIVVDATAADGMEDSLMHAVVSGHRLVLANKRPLTGNLDFFTALIRTRAARYEATVGAGLPIISTLQTLLDTGDYITRIEASMSGTLGYLCTAIEEGLPLSQAVRMARQSGWTEPDPREDLSGADVARKALILARTCGLPWNTTHVPGKPWFPSELEGISLDEFMERVSDLDSMYVEKVAQAHERGTVLRYVATIEPGAASIELRELPQQHPLAALRGTDNLFAFTTTRYAEQPLVVRGPGAGTEVTAAGVLGDIIASARELQALL